MSKANPKGSGGRELAIETDFRLKQERTFEPKTSAPSPAAPSSGATARQPAVGDFIQPPDLNPDAEERADALPEQEAFWKPPVRFGSVPVEKEPLGWDRRKGFRKLFPAVYLPFQVVERVSFGHPALEPNRLFWGDNLHVMRQLPSESIDLIYIDPPFFSGRNYNVIFGDRNELRSFSDIWEGGMPGYLIWLNARLYEMKRLLKKTGSIYVHCDWHASHYIKVEMDKIFGAENFRNELVWQRTSARADTQGINHIHDIILVFSNGERPKWNKVFSEYSEEYLAKFYRFMDAKTGRRYRVGDLTAAGVRRGESGEPWRGVNPTPKGRHWAIPALAFEALGISKEGKTIQEMLDILDANGFIHWPDKANGVPGFRRYLDLMRGVPLQSVWTDIPPVSPHATERIGYPTQKPETLLERIIKASSDEGDVVADFFIGGGTTAAVAQRLGRRWIASDQSRVAVAITADRLTRQVEEQTGRLIAVPDFTIEHWGVYEARRLADMPPEQFRGFVLKCFGATPETGEADRINKMDKMKTPNPVNPVNPVPTIHGYKGAVPVWVGDANPKKAVTAQDVQDFANAIRKTLRYKQDNLRDGIMLAWAFRPDAMEAAERLRRLENTDLNFVRLEQVRIDSPRFREHVAALSTDHADYENFLTFVQPPRVEVGHKRIAPRTYVFDVSETVVLNAGAKIINVQWDFDYGERFSSTPGFSFVRGAKSEPQLQAQYEFPRAGKVRVACKVQDDMGGEGLWSGEIEVS